MKYWLVMAVFITQLSFMILIAVICDWIASRIFHRPDLLHWQATTLFSCLFWAIQTVYQRRKAEVK